MNKIFTLALLALSFTAVFTLEGCDDANLSSGKCTVCQDGYFGTGGGAGPYDTCTACSLDNCATCTSATVCTSCKAGFGVNNKVCAACAVANCGTCSMDSTTCTACSTGYNFPIGNTDRKTCSLCSNNCATCPNTIIQSCSSCQTGLTLNNTNTAAQFCCSKNCVQCDSATTCTKCKDGVNLDKDTGACFGFKTGASLTLGAVVAVFALLF